VAANTKTITFTFQKTIIIYLLISRNKQEGQAEQIGVAVTLYACLW
jgi:hypothetical protein